MFVGFGASEQVSTCNFVAVTYTCDRFSDDSQIVQGFLCLGRALKFLRKDLEHDSNVAHHQHFWI